MSKWQVEHIGSQANILVENNDLPKDEWEPVGMGFPVALATRIVDMHNRAIDLALRSKADLMEAMAQMDKDGFGLD